MIFLIEETTSTFQVDVYHSLEQLTNIVEWQDVFEGNLIIMNEEGITYAWDASRITEYGTVYGYTLVVQGSNAELLRKCRKKYDELGEPDEFTIKK